MNRNCFSSIFLSATVFVFFSLFLSSCQKDDISFNIGDDFLSSENPLVYTDTITVKLSTVKTDSLVTSETSTALVGNYIDEFIGRIKAATFFQVGTGSDYTFNQSDFDYDCIFDSICIVLEYNTYHFGDTSESVSYYVHELTESFDDLDEDEYYNLTEIDYDRTELAHTRFVPYPNSGDEVTIKLPDDYGTTLLNALIDNDDVISSLSDFLLSYPGFGIIPDTTFSMPIIGYESGDTATAPLLRIYYHIIEEVKEEYTYTFPLTLTEQFNQISADLSEGDLNSLTDERVILPSSTTDDQSYIHSGVGIMTRVDFPYLDKFFELDKKNEIVSAELILKPVKNSYTQYTLPSDLELYATDGYNNLMYELYDYDESDVYVNMTFDELYGINTSYSVDISYYLQTLLSEDVYDDERGVVVALPSEYFNATFDKVQFDGSENTEYTPQLIIKYFTYE